MSLADFMRVLDTPATLRETAGLKTEVVIAQSYDPRIAKLEALIDHPATPPGERAAAQDALIRIEVGADD